MSAAQRKDESFLAFEATVVTTLLIAGVSQRVALGLLGISRGSWQYRTRPRPGVAEVTPRSTRTAPSWLSAAETEQILDRIKTGFGQGRSVYQCFYQALDAGEPTASLTSWYRIARAYLESLRPARPRKKRRSVAMPQWDATAAMQVWCWDITKLRTAYRNEFFDFYVVTDVFSRMIVAWRIEPTETGELAAQMFISAVGDHQGRPALVHSDGGTAMTSQSLTALFKNLGIEVSKNRPRVSNDNPHAEALFKTAKYGPGVPVFFDTIEQARAWAETFVEYYNHDHRHSSLEGHTPASVHDGSWGQVHKDRQATLDKLAGQHPERYRKPITVKAPYAHVTLNTPSDQKTEDRLKTG